MGFDWDERMLEALAAFGVRPGPSTSPAIVKDFVGALYRYELRRLRDRLVRGDVAKPAYASMVAALRPRYWMLSIPAGLWARKV
jgi:hypothetical protein